MIQMPSRKYCHLVEDGLLENRATTNGLSTPSLVPNGKMMPEDSLYF